MIRQQAENTSQPAKDPQWNLTEQQFADQVRSILSTHPSPDRPTGPSDYDLNPGLRPEHSRTKSLRPAAVLIPIIAGPTLTVLLTQRTNHLDAHAGQIAFPGGKVDPEDADATTAATREAHEELGIDKRYIEPLGFLDCYETRSGFIVSPLVAFLNPGFTLTPNPDEVDNHFEVPLAHLMNPQNHRRHSRIWQGQPRFFYALPYGKRYIWGVTAGILVNMHKRLFNR